MYVVTCWSENKIFDNVLVFGLVWFGLIGWFGWLFPEKRELLETNLSRSE